MRKIAALLIPHALLVASCAELATKQEAPRHPNVSVEYAATADPEASRDESLIASLRALQRFHGVTPSAPYRVAAATGTARLLAAHPRACPAEWTRGGRALGLSLAGNRLGLELTVLEQNPMFDDPNAAALDSLKQRRDRFSEHHHEPVLAELDAGRPVLASSGWSRGGVVNWGLVTRYAGESDTLYGHPSGGADEASLDFPPEVVVLVKPTGGAPVADDVVLLRHAFETAARIAATSPVPEVGAEPDWKYGLGALDIWRSRLAILPFCRFCGTGSWQCQQHAAGALTRSLGRMQELLEAARPGLPPESAPLVESLSTSYSAAREALAPSLEDSIEAKFQDQPGQREVAFGLTQLRKALEQAQGIERQLLAKLGATSTEP